MLVFARRAIVEQQPLCHFLAPAQHRQSVDAQSRWPGLIQAALLPPSIAQLAASALMARSTDRRIAALLLTAAVAVIASISRINPLWLLLAGGLVGFCWHCVMKIARQ
ncbi:hypothetical protein LPJ38_14780 [Bradyrhizobium daqingense]|uniref:hypothetical protein n=1 Tax=Bradyrhizobium daqingense TaxID=993502 RepID=UPI001E4FB637|nr:hypothetical protein [Bradyrhizobium daqingense]UFS91934.1 hypothetical protein LPJ38_14780 [Bradyrhizobium daqingense]